jgi:hypothetical protein
METTRNFGLRLDDLIAPAKVTTRVKVLGLHYNLDTNVLTELRLDENVAKRCTDRLRRVQYATRQHHHRVTPVRTMCLPVVVWAAMFTIPSDNDIKHLRTDVQ